MLMSKFTCPTCTARLKSVKPLSAGREIQCPRCGSRFPAPAVQTSPAPPTLPDFPVPLPTAPILEPLESSQPDPDAAGSASSGKFHEQPEKSQTHRARQRGLVIAGAVAFLAAAGITLAGALSALQKPAAPKADAPSAASEPGAGNVAKLEEAPGPGQDLSQPGPAPGPRAAPAAPPTSAATPPPRATEEAGERPLTQDWLDRWTTYTEWLLDIRLAQPERRQWQELWVKDWQQADAPTRERFWSFANAELQWSSKTGKSNEAERDTLRARKRPLFLASLRKSSDTDERMVVALYEAAHKPGGERNPILVAGTPPLAQETVDTWRRSVEWVLDVRLAEQQRRESERLFVAEWNKLDPEAKAGLCNNLNNWSPSQLPPAELQSELLAHLRESSRNELSRWLLAVYESVHRPGGVDSGS